MTAQVLIHDDRSYAKLTNSAATDVAVVFGISTPGTYGILAMATWGGGSLDLQALAADGSTFVSVLAAAFAANGYKTVDLPEGQYKFVGATASAIYATISLIKRGT